MHEYTFNQIFSIMEISFPASEFRTREGQKALLADPHYRLITEENIKGSIIAFMAVWEFPEFRFVEHIAVHPAARGEGLGDMLMRDYIAESPIPVLLEVEPPGNEWALRRIGFYERLGFFLNAYEYMQPPLRKGQADLPLYVMSYARPLSGEEFALFKKQLYRDVYKISSLP